MRKHIIQLILAALVFFTFDSFGQQQYNLPPKMFYQKAAVGMSNYNKMEVNSLYVGQDSIQCMNSNRKRIDLHLDDINYIRVSEGNKAKTGAIIGGASMFVISLLAVMQVESDPNYELRENVGISIGLYTLGGTGLGALIGSAFKRQKSYYVHVASNNP